MSSFILSRNRHLYRPQLNFVVLLFKSILSQKLMSFVVTDDDDDVMILLCTSPFINVLLSFAVVG